MHIHAVLNQSIISLNASNCLQNEILFLTNGQIIFQLQPAELPTLHHLPAAAAAVPGGQQQQARLPARGDRSHVQPDGAGRVLQRDRAPPRADRRPIQPQVAAHEEEPPSGDTSRSVFVNFFLISFLLFCYMISTTAIRATRL